jgi:cytochrome c-type biogenesis protein CcmH/NrfG
MRDAARQVKDTLELAAKAMESKVYATAIDLLTSARSLDPKNPQVLSALGWAVFRGQPGSAKTREQARQYLSEALAVAPDDVQALVPLGKIERLDGEFDRARKLFERVLTHDPENADAKHELDTLDHLGGRRLLLVVPRAPVQAEEELNEEEASG